MKYGSDVSVRNFKKGVIFDVADADRQKCLPQHHFSELKVHQTPSSFRFIRAKLEKVEEKQKFVHKDDQTVAIVRPKYYTGSSGSV